PLTPLTLIVAATPIPLPHAPTPANNANPKAATYRLGIGQNGTLPWPRIQTDMSFFARTTSRPPCPGTTNAILMGRKTYDSIPPSLRPLSRRINAVVTRSVESVRERVNRDLEVRRGKEEAKLRDSKADQQQKQTPRQDGQQGQTDAVVSAGLEEAVAELEAGSGGRLGQLFVIGGAEIYKAALRVQGRGVRIVMTFVEKVGFEDDASRVFECDTFFPVDAELLSETGWRVVSPAEVSGWVGETVSGEWVCDGGVRVRMVGYERV
ncbi:dihydrofolate reductase, partial [Aspergillus homomorphus CBS 101889]